MASETRAGLDRPTLDTVAAAAGVSRMTVANAYNRPDQLSAATRLRVLEAAAQLGYADAAKLLDRTLQEEKKTDALLTQIAERINVEGEPDADENRPASGKGTGAKARAA